MALPQTGDTVRFYETADDVSSDTFKTGTVLDSTVGSIVIEGDSKPRLFGPIDPSIGRTNNPAPVTMGILPDEYTAILSISGEAASAGLALASFEINQINNRRVAFSMANVIGSGFTYLDPGHISGFGGSVEASKSSRGRFSQVYSQFPSQVLLDLTDVADVVNGVISTSIYAKRAQAPDGGDNLIFLGGLSSAGTGLRQIITIPIVDPITPALVDLFPIEGGTEIVAIVDTRSANGNYYMHNMETHPA